MITAAMRQPTLSTSSSWPLRKPGELWNSMHLRFLTKKTSGPTGQTDQSSIWSGTGHCCISCIRIMPDEKDKIKKNVDLLSTKYIAIVIYDIKSNAYLLCSIANKFVLLVTFLYTFIYSYCYSTSPLLFFYFNYIAYLLYPRMLL